MFKVSNLCVSVLIRSLFLLPNFISLLYSGVLNKGFSFSISVGLGIFFSILSN